ncbi:hypothetical protein FA13DRAFT_1733819, partial [Coprinellus micaceus]
MTTAVPATCSAEFWSYNSLSQSPCAVGSALARACEPRTFPIPALLPNNVYIGPWAGGQNTPCRCSSAFYSLLSACAHCQTRNFLPWSLYAFNCTPPYVRVFPRDIPRGIAVPAWAYMNVEVADFWDPSVAQTYGGIESVAPVPTPMPTIVNDPPSSTVPHRQSQLPLPKVLRCLHPLWPHQDWMGSVVRMALVGCERPDLKLPPLSSLCLRLRPSS